jgi:predicted RNA-binding Zn-ribbon protein involved in translation (DUF1610 family)
MAEKEDPDLGALGRRLLEEHLAKGRPAPESALAKLLAERNETQAQKERTISAGIQWLQDKWVTLECPYCSSTAWEVGSPFVLRTTTAVLTPHFPVMCSNCGNTVLVNAVRAGLMPEPPDE